MHSTLRRKLLLFFLFAFLPGCINQWNTRLPQVRNAPPELEIRDFERNDPFADMELGPETFTRPRGFEQQRTLPRRMRELRDLQAARNREQQQTGGSTGVPPTRQLPAPTSMNYPNVVHP